MPSRLPAPLLRRLHWLASPAAGRTWRITAGVALLITTVLLIQDFFGLPFQTTIGVGPSDRITPYREATGTYRWKLPSRYVNQVMDFRAEMLEDGRPMSRCLRSSDVADTPATHYYIHNSAFTFGTGDASDVRTNGKKYEVQLPRPIKPEWLTWALVLLTLATTMLVRTNPSLRLCQWVYSWPTRLPAWTVGVAALIVLVGDLVWDADRTLGAMLVKGLPESDSGGWFDLGQRLAEGLGLDNYFGSQRPFYAIYLAALTMIAGPGLMLAKSFNAVLAALSAMGIFMMGRAMHRAWAGLGAAVYFTLAEDHLHTIHTMLTENPGTTFGVLSGLILVWALWKQSTWGCALAGLVTGICSLSSGELILTVPLFALLIFGLGVFRWLPFKRSLVLVAIFTLATSLVLLPWMAVQKARHGIFTLTLNTPELLCGGADPVHGKLDKALHAEANAKGFSVTSNVTGRYRYFSDLYASHVKADPLGYVWRVLNATRESLGDVRVNDPALRLLIPLTVLGCGLLGTLRWRAPQPLVLASALLLFLSNEDDPWPAHWLSLMIFALIADRWRGRRLLALLIVLITVLACMLLCGLSGNVASRRFWNVADWGLVLLWLAGASTLLRLIFAGVARIPVLGWGMVRGPAAPPFRQTTGGRLRECVPLAVSAVVISVVTLAMILVRHQMGPKPVYTAGSVATALEVTLPGEVKSVLVQFDDFTLTLGRWEHTPHWRPYYYPARESRWLSRPRQVLPDGTLGGRVVLEAAQSVLPSPPRSGTVLCVGTMNYLTDPLSGAPVNVLRVQELRPVVLTRGR